MCNRARNRGEPETLRVDLGLAWAAPRPTGNRANPAELVPRGPAWIIRQDERGRGLDLMSWDLLAGGAPYPMTNVRDLRRWRSRLERPAGRCLIPLTEFCEWTPKTHQVGAGRPIKGEMWFACKDQPLFAVAGVWQQLGDARYFAMLTCDPNELVAPVHSKAMVTILDRADWTRWLEGDYADVVALQRPYPAERMSVRGPVFPTRER